MGIIGKVFLFNLLSVFVRLSVMGSEDESFEQCLSELSVSELLRLKRSLDNMNHQESISKNNFYNETFRATEDAHKVEDTEQSCSTQNCIKPMALALTGKPRGYHASTVYHHHHQPWLTEEKPTKLQTFFQISITALAFLSFGGYLLCLIVQAIRSKGTTYFHPVTTAAPANNGGVKRIKVYRRGRRDIEKKHQQIEAPNFDADFFYDYSKWTY